MKQQKSSGELDNNIKSIKKTKHNLVIGSIIVLVLILTILAILLFNFKKQDLGIDIEKSKNMEQIRTEVIRTAAKPTMENTAIRLPRQPRINLTCSKVA